MHKRLKLGMVGGGQGAFIGAVHRIAARIDDEFELVAGALSSKPDNAKQSAAQLGIAPERAYTDFNEMAKAEAAREDGIDAVSIVTPNHMHFPVAKAFLEQGINVICDKPLTSALAEAVTLAEIGKNSKAEFVLTHNYSGYPMVREARHLVQSGALGKLRRVNVEYVQDWMSEAITDPDNKQAAWRSDPKQSGKGGAIADIGTHAMQLANFITTEAPEKLAADLTSFVEGRLVDDDAHMLMRYATGAKGYLWATQVAPGSENSLRIQIYGEKAGLSWAQENPNQLWYAPLNEPKRLLTRGGHGTSEWTQGQTRVPPGHPEGYLEGFATIYKEAADLIRNGRTKDCILPTLADGLLGMQFIDAAIRSSEHDAAWTPIEV
ncbi:Gfo/Idh/MocA family protein [Maritalea mediterranea]|uniref:Gfo/Idh/MocA family oxidoreductase n=1 Tax=Maritalea mediterranea TaxID=2909667 RepID=A0ABS9E5L3_9HYPH|nr:Gfo/Idh/MocA family oxidoreductase [Maritalea mediterranea]MCF4098142.1 Gfo/Idh/MocA family oxidoreductase [Maritalea mediterranea]